ncbi:MAG: hypothetical protein ABI837_12445 [Acidobacteriota bacterium]
MEDLLRQKIEMFLRPQYLDLDGGTRFEDVQRIGRIARRLTPPTRDLELLILFHGLGTWLEKIGNLSRAVLTLSDALTEVELRRTSASIRRLDSPVTDSERAVAAAIIIDKAGVRGIAERLARSRREGVTPADVARASLLPMEVPAWLPLQAVLWINERQRMRQEMCQRILDEATLEDLGDSVVSG